MDLSNIKRDASQIEAGQWVEDIPNMGDLRLRVRGLSSPLVVAVRSRKERRATNREKESDGTLRPDVAMRIFGETLHEAVLLDWSGMTDNDEPVPYSKELALQFLTDPDYQPFADAVTWAAQYVDRASRGTKDDLSKN